MKRIISVMVLFAMVVYYYSPDIQTTYDTKFYEMVFNEPMSAKLDFMSQFASKEYKFAYDRGLDSTAFNDVLNHVNQYSLTYKK